MNKQVQNYISLNWLWYRIGRYFSVLVEFHIISVQSFAERISFDLHSGNKQGSAIVYILTTVKPL